MDKVVIVPPHILRAKFNESNVASQKGLSIKMLRNSHLQQPEKKEEPWCTHSQMIRFLDENGQWVYEVHQYLRPNGTIGGKGRPDPKRLRLNGIIYTVPPK